MQERNKAIDVLRGIAVLFVILLHLNIRIPFSETSAGESMPQFLYKFLFWSGYYGVFIFFVISGFLITTSAMSRWKDFYNINIGNFYKIRFARIVPLLVVLLVVLSCLHIVAVDPFVIRANGATLLSSLLSALTFTVNWYEMQVGYLPASWDVLWTLSIEGVFYLIFPLLVWLTRKDRYFILLMVVFVLVAPLFRTLFLTENEFSDRNNLACMDAIAMGCISAIIAKKVRIGSSLLLTLQLAGFMLLGIVFLFRGMLYEVGITKIGLNISMLAAGTSMLLIYWQQQYLKHRTQRKYTVVSWLCSLGKNCYEVYLTHLFVVIAGISVFESCGVKGEWVWLLYSSVILFSGLLGQIISRYFTTPVNRWVMKYNKLSVS